MPENNLNQKEYISLTEAAKYCDYTQEYLSLRARQGKLKAKKFGRNWVTTKQWVEQYLADTNSEKANTQQSRANIFSDMIFSPLRKLGGLRSKPKQWFCAGKDFLTNLTGRQTERIGRLSAGITGITAIREKVKASSYIRYS